MQKEKISKIIDIINWGDTYFKEKGIPESRLNIELLLCAVLQCKRMNLYMNFDKPLIKNELEILRDFVKRRTTREPLQYIIGETEFMGLLFKVNPNVLIPRPETELLVEEIIKYTKEKSDYFFEILDIGSGSGNISISLAKFIPKCSITAIDYSKTAIDTGILNAELNDVKDNISFIQSDILDDSFLSERRYDIIVSNPPYISLPEYNGLEPELSFEPKSALTDSSDGLTFYRRIADIGKLFIKHNGIFAVEIAYNQGPAVSKLFHDAGYNNIKTIKDYSNLDRIITGINN